MSKILIVIGTILVLIVAFADFGGGGGDPLQDIVKSLKDVPTASVILADMQSEGTFSPTYYHKYSVLYDKANSKEPVGLRQGVTDWLPVSETVYKEREPYLGMTVFSKKEGKVSEAVLPPGYDYVGDTRYGRWERDSSGNQVWHWLAGYAMLSYLTGNRPIGQADYDRYRQERSKGRGGVWYGPKTNTGGQTYGTKGTVTQTQRPDFYQRRMRTEAAKKSSFSNKVQNRIGRTSTGLRGRSGGVGK